MRLAYSLLFLLLALLGCRPDSDNAATIVGSTSIQPFVEKLAEEYMSLHPRAKINVQGGGSTAGIIAVQGRVCQIGMSSRPLKPEETGINSIQIAHDAIAIIVHPENRVAGLSLEQIRDIFAGRIRNWSDLGGADALIVVVTREEGSGTRGAFSELVMAKQDISEQALVQDSNGAVREIVARDQNAMGYISFGLLDPRVKALTIDGTAPTHDNIMAGRYQLKRPFLILLRPDAQCALADSFVGYILSPRGQASLAQEGLIPIQP